METGFSAVAAAAAVSLQLKKKDNKTKQNPSGSLTACWSFFMLGNKKKKEKHPTTSRCLYLYLVPPLQEKRKQSALTREVMKGRRRPAGAAVIHPGCQGVRHQPGWRLIDDWSPHPPQTHPHHSLLPLQPPEGTMLASWPASWPASWLASWRQEQRLDQDLIKT